MKQIFSFLIWKIKKIDVMYAIIGFSFFVYWIGIGLGYIIYANIFMLIITLSILLKMTVYNNFVSSWKEYKKEKENLMNTIKNSTKD